MSAGNSFSVVLNVANDNTVNAFLNQKIKFNDIAKLNELAMEKHPVTAVNDLETIEELTIWTENFIKERV